MRGLGCVYCRYRAGGLAHAMGASKRSQDSRWVVCVVVGGCGWLGCSWVCAGRVLPDSISTTIYTCIRLMPKHTWASLPLHQHVPGPVQQQCRLQRVAMRHVWGSGRCVLDCEFLDVASHVSALDSLACCFCKTVIRLGKYGGGGGSLSELPGRHVSRSLCISSTAPHAV